MKKLKIGFIGLGGRGTGLVGLTREQTKNDNNVGGLMGNVFGFKNVVVTAVCDTMIERVERAGRLVEAHKDPTPFMTTDYKELVKQDLDAVIISAAWEVHAEIANACMEAGIAVGLEVGGAYDIQSCWDMVDCYERTKTPFMFLENCCYYKDELLATSLVRNGVLGKISYCQGSYCHDLRKEIADGSFTHHYRLRNYLSRDCENYPTHELGPIAKILNINRGNRLVSLVSMSSKAQGMEEYINANKETYKELVGKEFKQGDVVNTLIKCENGEMILIKLDTTLPRLYDRNITVSGTKGFYCQTTKAVILDNGEFDHETAGYSDAFFTDKNYDEYVADDWKNITEEQKKAGHGGMDFIMLKHFFNALLKGEEMPIDVYDGALWMSITALSAESIEKGSVPIEIPDFTRGKYKNRPSKDVIPIKIIKK